MPMSMDVCEEEKQTFDMAHVEWRCLDFEVGFDGNLRNYSTHLDASGVKRHAQSFVAQGF